MSDAAKVANVKHELALLEKTWKDSGAAAVDLGAEEANLTRVNEALWVIEDDIRDEERAGRFGEKFIELARAVYITNDERAAIKKRINTLLGSSIVEEKSYKPYKAGVRRMEQARRADDGGPRGRAGRRSRPAALFAARRMRRTRAGLKSMTGDVEPDRHAPNILARIDKARALMGKHGIGALLIEPGASLVYFTGMQWWRSERLTAAVLPREGDIAIVTPHFEEPSVRESLQVPAEVRVWNEDEDPLATVAGILRDRKVTAPVGVEETVRFFAVDGLRRAMPRVEIVQWRARRARLPHGEVARPSSRSCRRPPTSPSPRTATSRRASRRGMTPKDIGAMMDAAHAALGASPEFALVLLGEASAYPHGSGKPQARARRRSRAHGLRLRRARAISPTSRAPSCSAKPPPSSARCGSRCATASRSPSKPRASACPRARSTTPCARSTRNGVTARATNYPASRTAPATASASTATSPSTWCMARPRRSRRACVSRMSRESIYPGKFGIRLEDCFHMGAEKPIWFSTPPPSLDKPFG